MQPGQQRPEQRGILSGTSAHGDGRRGACDPRSEAGVRRSISFALLKEQHSGGKIRGYFQGKGIGNSTAHVDNNN